MRGSFPATFWVLQSSLSGDNELAEMLRIREAEELRVAIFPDRGNL